MIVLPGLQPKESRTGDGSERRATARFPFTATAEVFELCSQTRIAGRSSDLGPNGCYVDSISPFSEGTAVRLCLENGSRKFEAMARITYCHPSMGMGMMFTEIKPENLRVLQTWIAELSGQTPPDFDAAPGESEASMSAEMVTLRQVLNELIILMVRKKHISENEGAGLLRQMFR